MASTLENTTVIGAGTHIKGEMVFDSDALILGTFEGRISTKGEIQIGQQAVCKAAIEGASVIVDGQVEGDVLGTERVYLSATARVIGNIVAAALVVAGGACLNGHCRVGRGDVEAEEGGEPLANDSDRSADKLHRNGLERAAR
jgi:cytoskeletal protein CcmA (bactofilin family)